MSSQTLPVSGARLAVVSRASLLPKCNLAFDCEIKLSIIPAVCECVCVCCMNIHTAHPICGRQRTTSGVPPYLLPCLNKVSLLWATAGSSLIGLHTSVVSTASPLPDC